MPLFLVLFSLFLDHFFVLFCFFDHFFVSLFLCFFACSLFLSVCRSYPSFRKKWKRLFPLFLLSFSLSFIISSFPYFYVSLFIPFFCLSVVSLISQKKSLSFVSSLIFFAFYHFFVSFFLCLFPFLPVCLTLCFASQESPSGRRVSEDGRASLLPSFLPRRRRRRRRWA